MLVLSSVRRNGQLNHCLIGRCIIDIIIYLVGPLNIKQMYKKALKKAIWRMTKSQSLGQVAQLTTGGLFVDVGLV